MENAYSWGLTLYEILLLQEALEVDELGVGDVLGVHVHPLTLTRQKVGGVDSPGR